jgi:uncharacterized protein YbjT (DUF2867 family)
MTTTITVLGGTGKTARRIVPLLRAGGATVRTAARHGADVTFDWDRPDTYGAALDGATGAYVVAPAQRVGYADEATTFFDAAAAAGVGHVTLLSARNVDQLPAEVPMRAVELDLAGRTAFTHSIVRPGWFMQNFSESFLAPTGGAVVAPTGSGAEAFVHTQDIAEVAAATLLDPSGHAGAGYTLTGPEALTFAEVADHIAAAAGRPVAHVDVAADEWVAGLVDAGLPADYVGMLGGLLEAVRAGRGAATTDDVARVTGHGPRSFADFAAETEVVATWRAATSASAA